MGISHISAILTANLVEGIGDLTEAAVFYRIQQFFKEIAIAKSNFLQLFQS